MIWVFNDGGRAGAGYRGHTGDCVTRAISIALELPYQQVYDAINDRSESERPRGDKGRSSARTGVHRATIRKYLDSLGWTFTPTMGIGTGCKIHLKAEELPGGRIICSVSKHIVAVIDGVVQDTFDSTRGGTRCVYGYWRKA